MLHSSRSQRRLRSVASHLAAAAETALTLQTNVLQDPAPIENIVCTRTHPAANATADERYDFFKEAGYVVVEDCLQGEALAATQREFRAGCAHVSSEYAVLIAAH